MSTLYTSDNDLKLFVNTDVYYYVIDNRPLREYLKNDQAINTELVDLKAKTRYMFSAVIEVPVVETDMGAPYITEQDSEVSTFTISHGVAGASGDTICDLLLDGTSMYTNPGDRPVLNFADADKHTISIPTLTTIVPAGSILTVDVVQIQTGSPRWLRCEIALKPDVTASSASDF